MGKWKPLDTLAEVAGPLANFIPGVGPLVAGGIGALAGGLSGGGLKGALMGGLSGFGAGEAGLGDMTAGAGGLAGLGSGAGNMAGLSALAPGLLQGISSMGANQAYQGAVDAYGNRINAGPGNYNFSPADAAAYRGASDSSLSQLTDRRYGALVSDLGSRGLLSSGVAPSSFTALQNWQDNQRAASEANMYAMGQQRAMSIWDQQLAASQFGIGQLGGIAKSQQGAFNQAGYNAGAKSPGGSNTVPMGGTPPFVGGGSGWTPPGGGISPPSIFSGPTLTTPGGNPFGGSLWSPSAPSESVDNPGMFGGSDFQYTPPAKMGDWNLSPGGYS